MLPVFSAIIIHLPLKSPHLSPSPNKKRVQCALSNPCIFSISRVLLLSFPPLSPSFTPSPGLAGVTKSIHSYDVVAKKNGAETFSECHLLGKHLHRGLQLLLEPWLYIIGLKSRFKLFENYHVFR